MEEFFGINSTARFVMTFFGIMAAVILTVAWLISDTTYPLTVENPGIYSCMLSSWDDKEFKTMGPSRYLKINTADGEFENSNYGVRLFITDLHTGARLNYDKNSLACKNSKGNEFNW